MNLEVSASQLIDHAFDHIISRWKRALWIPVSSIVICVLPGLFLMFPIIQRLIAQSGGFVTLQYQAEVWGLYLIGFGLLVGFYVAAVRWHRVIVLDGDGARPSVWRFLGYMLGSLLCMFCILLLLLIPTFFIGAASGGSARFTIGNFAGAFSLGWFFLIYNALMTFVFAYLFLRVAPGLVSLAVGGPVSLRNGFAYSSFLSRQIAQIALTYTVATFLWSMAPLTGIVLPVILWLPLTLGLYWIAFMMSVSIMTVIYQAVLIEYATDKPTT
jgi:hypothetical protein